MGANKLGFRSIATGFGLRASSFAIGAAGLAVTTVFTGPHDDTFFEFSRLLAASDLRTFLEIVATDNQPPGAPLLTYLFLRAGIPLEALRLSIGFALLAVLSWSSFSGLRRLGWGLERAAVASGLFVMMIGWSPATAPVLVMLRYASLVLVAWVLAHLAGLAAIENDTPHHDMWLGAVLGASLLVSTTSLVLTAFWLGVFTLTTRSARRILRVIVGATPFALITGFWLLWAGPDFISNVISRSTGRPTLRTVIGQTYEQAVWPVLGIVSLPTPTVVVLGALCLLCLIQMMRSTVRRRDWWIALGGFAISVPAMVATQVVNGGAAGPSAVLLLSLAMTVPESASLSLRNRRALPLGVFGISTAALLVYGAAGQGILRPYVWDGSGAAASAIVFDAIRSLEGDERCVIESGDYSTAFLLRGLAIELASSEVPSCIENATIVVDVRGDHPARQAENESLARLLAENRFAVVNSTPAGLFPHPELRRRLGLQNTQDSHLVVTVHLRGTEG